MSQPSVGSPVVVVVVVVVPSVVVVVVPVSLALPVLVPALVPALASVVDSPVVVSPAAVVAVSASASPSGRSPEQATSGSERAERARIKAGENVRRIERPPGRPQVR